jgi:hypothetical protein
MQGIADAESAIVYRDNATVKLNFVSLDERVIPLPRQFGQFVWLPQTYKWDTAAPSVMLPDASGAIHSLSLTGKWTLLHVWDLLCNNKGLDALNEIATPEPSDLRIVGIEQGNHRIKQPKFGGYKMPWNPRRSLIRHPRAILFSPI